MKALTICQPYAHLIMLPDTHPRHKRVENRTWATNHRGLLYIHAGKSRDWIDMEDGRDATYDIKVSDMKFGAVIGVAKLLDCLLADSIHKGAYDRQYPWLRKHEHVEGPWCWILERPVPIGPWPYTGAQGLFEINDEQLDRIATAEINRR